jgi:hypothetical protein
MKKEIRGMGKDVGLKISTTTLTRTRKCGC